jgi:hypothetical protein
MGKKLLYYISRYLLQRWRVCSLIYDNIVEWNINQDIYTRTSISRTVTVSLYTTLKEPIQQHTAVRFNSWLRWTALNLRLQQTVTHFYSSDVRRPFRSQVQFVSCGCFLRAFSWVCWRRLRIRRILYLSSRGKFMLSCWQDDKNNLRTFKVKWLIK